MSFLRAHWRAIVVALALAGAFLLGRAGRPSPRVEIRKEFVEVVKWKDRIVERVVTVTVQAEAKKVYLWRQAVTLPDGTHVETHQESSEVTSLTQATGTTDKQHDHEQQSSLTQAALSVSDPHRASWGLGAGVEASLRDLEPELRIEGSYRAAGPLWLRAAVSTGGTASVNAAVEW